MLMCRFKCVHRSHRSIWKGLLVKRAVGNNLSPCPYYINKDSEAQNSMTHSTYSARKYLNFGFLILCLCSYR